ncbi:hypothetical protein C0J52_14375 [Blattella germanica]|nr:hypothetical protein C0J52_14375 [Blattella germanica]
MATSKVEKAYCALEFARTGAVVTVQRNFTREDSISLHHTGTAFHAGYDNYKKLAVYVPRKVHKHQQRMLTGYKPHMYAALKSQQGGLVMSFRYLRQLSGASEGSVYILSHTSYNFCGA